MGYFVIFHLSEKDNKDVLEPASQPQAGKQRPPAAKSGAKQQKQGVGNSAWMLEEKHSINISHGLIMFDSTNDHFSSLI